MESPLQSRTSPEGAIGARTSAAIVVEIDGLIRLNPRGASDASDVIEAVIEHVATRLVARAPAGASLRRLTDLRLGLLLPGSSKAEAIALGDELVAEARVASVYGLRFPLSIGVAGSPDDARDAESLIDAASIAASRSRGRGGDTVLGFHLGMADRNEARPSPAVACALASGVVTIALDPIIDVKSGCTVGRVARMLQPAPGPDDEFAPFDDAARMGRVFEFGQLVRATAAERFRTEAGGSGILVIPIHPAELLVEGLLGAEASSLAHAPHVVLRLLRGGDKLDAPRLGEITGRLRRRGIRFALDAIDTREGTRELLRAIQPEIVTLASACDRTSTDHESARRVLASYVAMAEELGITSMITDASDREMRDRIRLIGVRYVSAPEPTLLPEVKSR
jgi:EAL domain-containing protein (putative c-di-GMP-specific phosphodiesterase class I)/GGDEF domain-containing protein